MCTQQPRPHSVLSLCPAASLLLAPLVRYSSPMFNSSHGPLFVHLLLHPNSRVFKQKVIDSSPPFARLFFPWLPWKESRLEDWVQGLLDQVKADPSQVNFKVGRAFSEKKQSMEPGMQQFLVLCIPSRATEAWISSLPAIP